MKKIALILLICTYSLSTFGVGIKQFYCCGILQSTSITFAPKETKEKCGKENVMSDCCKTKFTSLKVKDSHIAADDIKNSVKHFNSLHLFTPALDAMVLANQPMVVANTTHAPPPKHGIPIYIFCCTYRI